MRTPILIALLIPPLIFILSASPAAAADSCDGGGGAGVVCPDNDGDGFAACGCALSGSPCDCNDSDPTVYPNAPEACDSPTDKNCNSQTNEVCSDPKLGCNASVCVSKCVAQDDFGCPPESNFSPATDSGGCLCLPKTCAVFGCAPGSSCDETKTCVPTCNASVRCPHGERCRGVGCVDPCAGIACPSGATCRDGLCVSACDCAGAPGCPSGESCDAAKSPPRCVETTCIGVACAEGLHCEKGTCLDDCADVVCPPRLVCKKVPVGPNGSGPIRGRCTDLCKPDPCTAAFECEPRTGSCIPRPTADGGLQRNTDEILGAELRVIGGGGAGCGNTAASGSSSYSPIGLVMLFVAIVVGIGVARARRRRE